MQRLPQKIPQRVVVMAIQGQFVPNHVKVMEAMSRAHFTSHQFRFLNALIRLTYGYHGNRQDGYRGRANLKYWQDQTGMAKSKTCEVIRDLKELGVITLDGQNLYQLLMPEKWDKAIFSARPKLCRVCKEGNGEFVKKGTTICKEGNDHLQRREFLASPIKKTSIKKTVKESTHTPSECVPAPEPKKRKQPNPQIKGILDEMKRYLGYPDKIDKDPIPSYGVQGSAINRMLTRGFTREEVLGLWKAKVDQRGGEFVSMVWVNEDIGKSKTKRREGGGLRKPGRDLEESSGGWDGWQDVGDQGEAIADP